MLVGKMKAWLCAALAATASGFGSICADNDVQLALDSSGMVASCAAGLAEYGGACSPDMYTLGNAKMQELCAASNSPACDEGAPPGWFMETCPTSCGAC